MWLTKKEILSFPPFVCLGDLREWVDCHAGGGFGGRVKDAPVVQFQARWNVNIFKRFAEKDGKYCVQSAFHNSLPLADKCRTNFKLKHTAGFSLKSLTSRLYFLKLCHPPGLLCSRWPFHVTHAVSEITVVSGGVPESLWATQVFFSTSKKSLSQHALEWKCRMAKTHF